MRINTPVENGASRTSTSLNANEDAPTSQLPAVSEVVADQSKTTPAPQLQQTRVSKPKARVTTVTKKSKAKDDGSDLSYNFDKNSCWLDVTLESVYRCVAGDVRSLEQSMHMVGHDSALYALVRHLVDRVAMSDEKGVDVQTLRQRLMQSRDAVRITLADKKISRKLYDFDSIWVRYTLSMNYYLG